LLQDEGDEQKEFVGGDMSLRYTGMLKFYIPKRGYGYIEIDDGFDYAGEDVPKEIRVEHVEMNCGPGGNPDFLKDLQVEFGIWKTKKGFYKAYNCTLPDMVPLPSK